MYRILLFAKQTYRHIGYVSCPIHVSYPCIIAYISFIHWILKVVNVLKVARSCGGNQIDLEISLNVELYYDLTITFNIILFMFGFLNSRPLENC